jgi:hypothetical protein
MVLVISKFWNYLIKQGLNGNKLPFSNQILNFKQVTDGNSQLLNKLQMVTDSNKMVILPFLFVYYTLNE